MSSSRFTLRASPVASLITQRVAMRPGRKIGLVKRLAKFAAINFGFLPNQFLDFFRIVVPALEMSAAEFSFLVFLVAGALRALLHFHFRGGRFEVFRCNRSW